MSISPLYKQLTNNRDFRYILSSGGLVILGGFYTALIGLLSTSLVINHWGSEELGRIAIVDAYLGILSTVAIFGTDLAMSKTFTKLKSLNQNGVQRMLFGRIVWFVLTLSVAIFIVTFILVENNNAPFLSYFYLASFFVLAKAALTISSGYLKSQQLRGLYVLSTSLLPTLYCCALLGLMNRSYVVSPLLIKQICMAGISAVILIFLYAHIFSKIKITNIDISTEDAQLSRFLCLSGPMMLTSLMMVTLAQIDVLMLGYFLPEKDVGVYTVAVRLAVAASLLMMAINTFFSPLLTKIISEASLERASKLFNRVSVLMGGFSLCVFFAFFIFGKYVLGYVFGEEALAAYFSLMILSGGKVVASMCGPVGHTLNMMGKQKANFYINSACGLANIYLNYIFIPLYGIEGAAFSTALSIALKNIFSLIIVKRLFQGEYEII